MTGWMDHQWLDRRIQVFSLAGFTMLLEFRRGVGLVTQATGTNKILCYWVPWYRSFQGLPIAFHLELYRALCWMDPRMILKLLNCMERWYVTFLALVSHFACMGRRLLVQPYLLTYTCLFVVNWNGWDHPKKLDHQDLTTRRILDIILKLTTIVVTSTHNCIHSMYAIYALL